MEEQPGRNIVASSRSGEIVSGGPEPADRMVTKLSLLSRIQYWFFRKGLTVGQSHWTSDIRFVIGASFVALVLMVAAGMLVGGTGLFNGPEPSLPTPPTNLPLAPANTH